MNKDFYALNYEVTERFEQLDKEDLIVDYLVSVKLNETEGKGFITEVRTSDIKKYGISPDEKMAMISLACMESISPIAFSIPAQGKIKSLYDHKALVKKLESKRPDLEDFFIGEVNKTYLDKFHSSVKNENYLLKQFQSALLYQILFPEMDCFRRKNEWKESFYVIQNSFPVQCLFHTKYNFENPYDVEIIIKGKIEESCSLQELLRRMKFEELPEDKVTGEIELRYTTSKETRKLKNIEASIILLHQEELYRKQSLLLRAKEENPARKFSTLLD